MKYLLVILSVFLLHTSVKSDDFRRITEGLFKEAFLDQIKLSELDIPKLDKCTEQLYTIKENLKSEDPLTFYHSFEVFDAWGKVPSGIAYGHLVDLGNYQQCIHIDFTTLSSGTQKETNVVGKYCQAKIPIQEIVQLVRQPQATEYFDRGHVEGPERDPPLGIGIGICIPKECDSIKIAAILTDALNGTKVQINNCSTKDKPDYETIDYVAFGVFGLIALLLILSTTYDCYTEMLKLHRNESYLVFSIIHNAQKLFAISTKPNPNSINCLHGIRSLSMVWVILGHTLVWYIFVPLLNLKTVVGDWRYSAMALIFLNAAVSVDTFFFLSGLLIAWIGLKELEKNNGRINVVMMYVHRLFRLLPMIAIVILFVMSLMKFCGSGPNWPTYLWIQKYPCEKTWWRTLLFIQNYDNDLKCLAQSWYLAVDMQLFLISPLILLGLYKWGKKFIPVIVLAAALSIGCVYGIYVKNDFTKVISGDDMNHHRKPSTYYVTHTRYTIWLMGITFGYILTQFKNKEVKIPLLYNLTAWVATVAVVISVVLGPYNSQQPGYEGTALEAATYDTFSRVGWGFALSWIIFACHHGYGGVVNGFLSSPIWQLISKLSFSMYMTHFTIQIIIYGNFQTSLYFSNFDAFGNFWTAFGFTITASIALFLSCEAPIIALEKILFSRWKTQVKTVQVEIVTHEKASDPV